MCLPEVLEDIPFNTKIKNFDRSLVHMNLYLKILQLTLIETNAVDNSTIVQNLYSKAFYYLYIKMTKEDFFCFFLKIVICIHLMNSPSNLLSFYFIKPINFNAAIQFF